MTTLDTLNLDELYGEDDQALDFDSEPEPLDGYDAIDRRLSTLHRAQVALDRFDKLAAERRAELEARITDQRRPLLEKVGWLTRSLELAHQALLARDPKLTRVVLTNGVLASKAGGVEWVWPDDGTPEYVELVEWVKAHVPDAYNQPDAPDPRPRKDELKKAVAQYAVIKDHGSLKPYHFDGAIVTPDGQVPGVQVKAKPRTFTAETAGIE